MPPRTLAPLLTAALLAAAVAFRSPADPAPSPADPGPLPVAHAAGPRYWKGNLHTHSLWSDGDDFPEMIADWYKRHGYHFLALTEHNVLADGDRWIDAAANAVRKTAVAKYEARFGRPWVERREANNKLEIRLKPLREFRSLLEEPARFLLVPAEEITHQYARAPVHVNGFNLREVVKPLDGRSVGETIRVNLAAVADHGKRTDRPVAAALNHPNFRWGVTAEDMLAADNLRFFEVFNGHPGVENYGDADRAGCERIWDIVLAVRLGKLKLPVVYGLATDDAHRYHQWGVGQVNPGRGWVMVRAPYLSAEAMLRGLDAGDFYSSSGVALDDVRRDGRQLSLAIRGEPGVTYKTQFIATMRDAPLDGEPVAGKDGQPLPRVTRRYGPEVGKVVAEADGLTPSYTLTGRELYVRAKVISTKPHPNPYKAGDVEVAWTQPVVP